ncbi:ABC transporter permease [Streptomyces sp. Rer75]|uniref:ABC transporter permease n=1 Tax=Streptomyces sp. Rer75 TaxID=2750011 RepID=UPI0015D036AF|nr:ABC transporter permease [Streptomyces sp. Rer75]QLH20559.1 ABC transporter permease [Streptomyces sp. Rer75]
MSTSVRDAEARTNPATAHPAQTGARPVGAWRIVTAREIAVKLRDRGFLVSTLVTLALIVGAIGLQVYLASTAGKVTIAATGTRSTQIVRQAQALADRADQDVTIKFHQESSQEAVESAVTSGKADAGLVPSAEGWLLVGDTGIDDTAATWLGAAVQNTAMADNASNAGTSLGTLTKDSALGHKLLSPESTPESVVRMATFFFGFLFYLAAVMLGVALATSIVEEKQNRIVEIIASSIRLRDLLIGKIVGHTMLALVQMAAFSAAGAIGLIATGHHDVLSQITVGLSWFLAYYLVGIAVLACVFAAAGAIAGRSEDIQSTTTPVNMVAALVLIAGITASGTAQTVLSYVPLTSTITMPIRIIGGDVSWWEPIVSMLISLFAAAGVVGLSERIYRRALMQTGGKLSFRQALKLTD